MCLLEHWRARSGLDGWDGWGHHRSIIIDIWWVFSITNLLDKPLREKKKTDSKRKEVNHVLAVLSGSNNFKVKRTGG